MWLESEYNQYLSMLWIFFSSRRRHTMYWRDWSSDVCSSDLRRSDAYPCATGGGIPCWTSRHDVVPAGADSGGVRPVIVRNRASRLAVAYRGSSASPLTTIDSTCRADRWRTPSSPDTRPCSPSRSSGPAGPAASGRAVRSAMRPSTVCGGAGADSSTGGGTDGDAGVEVALPVVAALVGRSSSAATRATTLLTPRAAAPVAMAISHRERRRREAGTAGSGCRTHPRVRGRELRPGVLGGGVVSPG